ncbi:retrotransposon protein, putative, ty1-copia subclass [Tanacetum coccineum]
MGKKSTLILQAKIPSSTKEGRSHKDSTVIECGETEGSWKRNSPQYLPVAKDEKEDNLWSWLFSAIPRDGIFEIDLSNSYANDSCKQQNDSSMYVVSNKRAKLDLDSALLWHCRLGHISKKRIKKLQHDGLLNSTDLRSFEKCVPLYVWKDGTKTLHTSSGKGQRSTWTYTH